MCAKNKLSTESYSLKLDDGITEVPLFYSVKDLGVGSLTLSKKKKKSNLFFCFHVCMRFVPVSGKKKKKKEKKKKFF